MSIQNRWFSINPILCHGKCSFKTNGPMSTAHVCFSTCLLNTNGPVSTVRVRLSKCLFNKDGPVSTASHLFSVTVYSFREKPSIYGCKY